MSTQNADAFLRAVGHDDGEEEGVTRRRRQPAEPPAVRAPQDTQSEPLTAAFTPPVRRSPEPKQKVSVDLRWSLKQALDALCERDRRGPKAELNEALEAHLRAKGIDIPEWTN